MFNPVDNVYKYVNNPKNKEFFLWVKDPEVILPVISKALFYPEPRRVMCYRLRLAVILTACFAPTAKTRRERKFCALLPAV